MKLPVIVILGPTAAGKSACGIQLAKRIKGEIISGDSMLVYKRMNIATAKPSAHELAEVPHHLVDILEPDAEFNVVDFKEQAERLIADINARGHMPIIVGGTGLYIKALLENYQFADNGATSALRDELDKLAELEGNQALHNKLAELDPAAAARLHTNDRHRIIRAIELAQEGMEVSQKSQESQYNAMVFGVYAEREILYPRINKRVDEMVEAGVFAETKALLESGVPADCQGMRSIGYRQIVDYYQGVYTYEQSIEKLKQSTRNFAKRQFTWYKKMEYTHWFQINSSQDITPAVYNMVALLEENKFLE